MQSRKIVFLFLIWAGLCWTAWGQTASPPELPSVPSAATQQPAHPSQSALQNATPASPANPAPTPAPAAPAPNSGAKNPAASNSAGEENPNSESDQSLLPASEVLAPRNATAPAPTATAPADSTKNSGEAASGTTTRKPAETILVPVNEVNLIFTVTDKHGHFIRNLTQNDIKVVDDHKPVDNLRAFRSETDLPLRVGLLVDASNSVRDRFKFEQEAAIGRSG